jgi:hypothetical protein
MINAIRRFLIRHDLIEARPLDEHAIRSEAMKANEYARDEVHASRTKRTVIGLEYQLAQRRHEKQHR